MSEKYTYEHKHIGKGRKLKSCDNCGKIIQVGEPSITVTCFNSEFYSQDACSKNV